MPEELAEQLIKRASLCIRGHLNVCFLPGTSRVTFDLRPGFEGQQEVVASRISEVAAKLCRNYRPEASKTLVKRDLAPSFQVDPHPLLAARGDIVEFGRGRYGFGPRMVAMVEYFESRARRMAAKFHAEAHSFPSLIGADVLDRCRYLKNFPSSLNLVCHLREDHGVLQEFARSVRWDGTQMVHERASLSEVECLLSPSVCFHWYRWLQNSTQPNPRAITALGKCFRYESSNLSWSREAVGL